MNGGVNTLWEEPKSGEGAIRRGPTLILFSRKEAILKKNSLSSKAITFLLKVGMLYKSDFSLFITLQSSRQNASKTINKMLKEGTIKIANIVSNRKNKEIEEAYYLSKEGRALALDLIDDEFLSKNSRSYFSKFRTTSPALLNRHLQENTIKMMFHLCGIPVATCDKPSLINLHNILLNRPIEKTLGYPIDDDLNPKDAKAFLDRGIYYTSEEYIKFSNYISFNRADTFIGSRFKGVYISNSNCFIVYSAERGANKILRINYDKENNLKQSLLDLKDFTNIYRDVKELFSYKQSKNDPSKLIPASKVKNEPYALVISDGYSEVYSMATGNPSGLIKNVDFSKVTNMKMNAAEIRAEEEMEKIYMNNPSLTRETIKANYGTLFLDGYSKIFEHIFVAPRNYVGVRSLNYLCNNTLESWNLESRNLFKNNPKHFNESSEPFLPYTESVRGKNILATYLPVFDVVALRKLSNKDFSTTIVTYEDMIDTIARSTRKENRYYDCEYQLDDGRYVAAKLFDSSSFYIYEQNGYIKGEWIIRSFLSNMELVPKDMNIYSKLPELVGYDSPVAFYNGIASKDIDVKEVVPFIDCKHIKVSSSSSKNRARSKITFTVGKDYRLKLLKVANNKNVSIQQYLVKVLLPIVDKDYEEYNSILQQKKREWKS